MSAIKPSEASLPRRRWLRLSRIFLLLVLLVGQGAAVQCAAQTHPTAAKSGLRIVLGEGGLRALNYQGVPLLDDGAFRVRAVTWKTMEGTLADADLASGQARTDRARQQVTWTYPWGLVQCTYHIADEQLRLAVVVDNRSDQVLQGITLQLMSLTFPATPSGFDGNPRWTHNVGSPSVISVNYGTGVLALCNDDIRRPLIFGFPSPTDGATQRHYPVWASSSNRGIGWLSPYLDPVIDRPVPAHSKDTYHFSLRFGPAGSQVSDLTRDLSEKYAAAFPVQLKWPDRRPIGYLMLSSTVPHPTGGKNPRGWFNNDPTIDVTTEAGRTAFRQRVLAYADNSIRILKSMGAQGTITWDVEGQEYPHATSYIGDPRLVGQLAPEMDSIADAYFARFRRAGLRVGVCIRPQQFDRVHGQQDLSNSAEIIRQLVSKIALAHRRWGCTLFYVDSNGDPNVPYNADIFRAVTQELARRHIHALLMPEHQNTLYYAYTAPYDELRGGVASTPEAVRRVYPHAFQVISVPDGPMDARHAELVAAVRRGDILVFRAWFDDTYNDKVRSVYKEARTVR